MTTLVFVMCAAVPGALGCCKQAPSPARWDKCAVNRLSRVWIDALRLKFASLNG